MPPNSIAQQLQQAIAHHEAGQLQQAQAGYNQILSQFPNHPQALHLLGVLAGQAGRHDVAAGLFRRAITVLPHNVDFHRNLGFALQSLGDMQGAVNSFAQVVTLQPDNAEALLQLGNAQWGTANYQSALQSYKKSLVLRPNHAQTHCNMASALMMLGHPDQAVVSYERVISLDPEYPEARVMLGNALVQLGRFDAAIDVCAAALKLNPNDPGVLNNLGNAQKGKGDLDGAIESYHRAIAVAPDFAEAINNLGNVLAEKKELRPAIDCFEKAVRIAPQNPEFHFSLATALQDLRQWEPAIAGFHRALQLRQDDPKIFYNLGSALKEKIEDNNEENFDAPIEALRKAVALKPDYWQAILNLGICLLAANQKQEAFSCFNRVIELKPDSAEAYNNLGVLLKDQGHADLALEKYDKAIELKPDYPEAFCNQGSAWKELGKSDNAMESYEKAHTLKPGDSAVLTGMGGVHAQNGEVAKAISCYQQVVDSKPDRSMLYDTLLFTSLYDPLTTAEHYCNQARKWDEKFNDAFADENHKFQNDPDPDRKLRIGYVSPDFREHVVSRFVLPLMENHDPATVEIFDYAEVKKPDAVTDRMKKLATTWRSTVGKNDDQVAAMIHQDRIDILVDLAGHTGDNRLPVFARRPAPVQVSYLGYPASTGMKAIDYRITDMLSDPPGMTEIFCTEQLIRLGKSNWCYEPPHDAPPVYPSPAEKNGYVTFCSFNNFAKVNTALLGYWAEILAAVPNSRLVVKSKGVSASVPKKNIHLAMAQQGVSEDRIQLLDWLANSDHFSQFANVDIALDCYPYNGTTTTCEALWMGIPVVTLAGPSHVSRVGVSLMTNVGLPDLIGHTPQQYISTAVSLASDLPRLTAIRKNLRDMMMRSPLMDGPGLARGIEHLYRSMWRKWCASQHRSHITS